MSDILTTLIMQGGGALGAYQAGAYESLTQGDVKIDWVIGTSIGAINGAIIAGNPPEHRVERLRAFWESLAPSQTWLDAWSPARWLPATWAAFNPFAPVLAAAAKDSLVFGAVTQGVPGFFIPRAGAAFDLDAPLAPADAGFYDTSPLRQTLRDHIDFNYLNAGHTRLSVCAVDIETAELKVFDSSQMTIGAEHIMASGALPPAFPPVMIKDRAYWDGGICSNTPLEVALADADMRDMLVFMIDLWDPTETLPTTMSGVLGRQKDIQYSSRATTQIAQQARIQDLQRAIRMLAEVVPANELEKPEIAALATQGCDHTVSVVRLIMRALDGDDQYKDVDFSAATVAKRWAAGGADARRALKHKAWLKPLPPHAGLVVHELDQNEASP
jgi:NTE family protein